MLLSSTVRIPSVGTARYPGDPRYTLHVPLRRKTVKIRIRATRLRLRIALNRHLFRFRPWGRS